MGKQPGLKTAVVAEDPAVCERLVEMKEVRQTALKSPPDHFFGNVVSARADSMGYSFKRGFGARQGEKEQSHLVAGAPCLGERLGVAPAGQGRFESESLPPLFESLHLLQHDAASLECRSLGLEG